MIEPKNIVWTEKYRPRRVEDVVGNTKNKILPYLANPSSIQNFLFYSQAAGSGKTSMAKAIINNLGCDALFINSSDDRTLDVIRESVKQFAMTQSSKEGMRKCIFMDEFDGNCLPENTEIFAGTKENSRYIKIQDLRGDKYTNIPSVNIETGEIENDYGILIDSGEVDFYEIELEDGRKIVASPNHPFFNKYFEEIKLKELNIGDEIIDMDDDAFNKCSICGKRIFKKRKRCSIECQNKYHATQMSGSGNPSYGIKFSQERCEKISEKLKGRVEPEWKRKKHSEFMKINNPMNNEESRMRVSEALKGRKISEETRQKLREINTLHRGTDFYEQYCNDRNLPFSLKHMQLKYKSEKQQFCRICGKESFDKGTAGIQLHHINKNRKENSYENIIPLCARCHAFIHRGDRYVEYNNWKMQHDKKIKYYSIILYGDKI